MTPPIMYTKLLIIWIWSIGICQAEVIQKSIVSSIFDRYSQPEYNEISLADNTPIQAPTTERPGSGIHTYKTCGRGRECVRHYLCVNGKVNRNGETLIDIRSHIWTETNYNGTESESTNESEENYATTEDDDDIGGECPYLETCCFVGYKDEMKTGLPSNAVRPLGEVSWIVLIYVAQAYLCGGALITPRVVLTAGHRVQRKSTNSLKVRAGEWEHRRKTERTPDQYRQVVDVAIHRQFDLFDLRNDVALLFLKAPFNVGLNEGILTLPPAGFNFDHSRCQLTGRVRTNGRNLRNITKIELSIIPSSQCEANYRSNCLGSPWLFKLDPSHLCAIGEDRPGPRKPNIGSPLICPMSDGSNRWFLAGILVDKVKCRHEHVPALYASVPQLRQWIDEQLAKKGSL